MNFDPKSFFIGLLDFFSIILPGAMFTCLLYLVLDDRLDATRVVSQLGNAVWLAFLFISYLNGHLLFLLGALMDEWLYDPIRAATYSDTVKHLARGRPLASATSRFLAKVVFGWKDDAVKEAIRIKESYLTKPIDKESVNAFQWCKARLVKEDQSALAVVQRFEADSKFFRSFSVVLALLATGAAIKGSWAVASISLGLLVLSLYRYMEQRYKSTQQAYWFIITMEGLRKVKTTPLQIEEAPESDMEQQATHAGGIVYFKELGVLRYLVVKEKEMEGGDEEGNRKWVLPKGHIEKAWNEPARETAVREVREEAGVWARIKTKGNEKPEVLRLPTGIAWFYTMEGQRNMEDPEEKRDPQWLTWKQIEDRKAEFYPKTRVLLRKAERRLCDRAGLGRPMER